MEIIGLLPIVMCVLLLAQELRLRPVGTLAQRFKDLDGNEMHVPLFGRLEGNTADFVVKEELVAFWRS